MTSCAGSAVCKSMAAARTESLDLISTAFLISRMRRGLRFPRPPYAYIIPARWRESIVIRANLSIPCNLAGPPVVSTMDGRIWGRIAARRWERDDARPVTWRGRTSRRGFQQACNRLATCLQLLCNHGPTKVLAGWSTRLAPMGETTFRWPGSGAGHLRGGHRTAAYGFASVSLLNSVINWSK